ncbi:MAG: hypothetical protein Q4B35_03360 [Slackia sp.]|nr:hypothetical protein [Slackia sp.]
MEDALCVTEANDAFLLDRQKEMIAMAANQPWYRNSPVPDEVKSELSPYFISFVYIPDQIRPSIDDLYSEKYEEPVDGLCEDWKAAFESGSIYQRADGGVGFPLRFKRMNGHVAEAIIKRNTCYSAGNSDFSPWRLMNFPRVQDVALDDLDGCADGESCQSPASFADSEPGLLPERLGEELSSVLETSDFRSNRISSSTIDSLGAYERFQDMVYLNARWRNKLVALVGYDFDVLAFLDREWNWAKEQGILKEYEGR